MNILDLIIAREPKTLPDLSQIVVHFFLDLIRLVFCCIIDFVKSFHRLWHFLELTYLMPLDKSFEFTDCVIDVREEAFIF